MPDITRMFEAQAQEALGACLDLIGEQVTPGVRKQTVTAVSCDGSTIVDASPMDRQEAVELLGSIGAALAWQLGLDPPDAALLLEQGAACAGRLYSKQVVRTQRCE